MDFISTFRRVAVNLFSLLKNLYFWSGLIVLIALAYSAYALVDNIIMPSVTRHEASTTVPIVEGKPLAEAEQLLRDQGLTVRTLEQRFNPTIPANIVVDQNPPPNALVKPGRQVYLTINTGSIPMVHVPNLAGLSLREAENRLNAIGLLLEEALPDSIPSPYANTITLQDPVPNDSLLSGSGVRLWYSTGLGRAFVTVPDVTNLPVSEAQGELLIYKLRSVVLGMRDDEAEDEATISEDNVISQIEPFVSRQSPAPGTRMREGSEIRLFVQAITADSAASRTP